MLYPHPVLEGVIIFNHTLHQYQELEEEEEEEESDTPLTNHISVGRPWEEPPAN